MQGLPLTPFLPNRTAPGSTPLCGDYEHRAYTNARLTRGSTPLCGDYKPTDEIKASPDGVQPRYAGTTSIYFDAKRGIWRFNPAMRGLLTAYYNVDKDQPGFNPAMRGLRFSHTSPLCMDLGSTPLCGDYSASLLAGCAYTGVQPRYAGTTQKRPLSEDMRQRFNPAMRGLPHAPRWRAV